MRRLRERAGIPRDENNEQLTMYDNRRAFATEMAADETIAEAVRTEALGHTQPQTTQDYYIRLKAQQTAEATRKTAERMVGQSDESGK